LLRESCGAIGTAGSEALWRQLSELIRRHAATLPDDLRFAVLVAVGLHHESRQRFLTERLRWALQFYGRDATRTVERLANRGLRRIAQSIHTELADRARVPASTCPSAGTAVPCRPPFGSIWISRCCENSARSWRPETHWKACWCR
jgi:hypothetical protein